MTKNPLINSLCAAGYIALVASVMFYGKNFGIEEPNIIIPVGMISLLTLSVAMMGYLFFFQPIQMYLDGDKQGGANLFLRTLGSFAIITILIFIIIVLGWGK